MKAIVAMGPYRVIGYKGIIPWYIPDDLKWFKKMTSDPKTGGYLVMGYTTFQNVGLLPDRFTYILTNDPEKLRLPITKNHRYLNFADLMSLTIRFSNIWVVGGAKTYAIMLPYCQEVYATHIMDEYEGDVYMPMFEDQFPNSEIVQEFKDRWIVRYWKNYEH